MNEKSVNWKRSCWKRSATWRRGRRRLWRLLQTAQQNTFRACRTNSSVSNWTSRKRTLGFSKRNWNKKATGFEQTGFFCLLSGLQKRMTSLPPTLRSMKTDYASLRSQVRNFSEFYGAAISEAKKQVCGALRTTFNKFAYLTKSKSFMMEGFCFVFFVFWCCRFQLLLVRYLKPTKISWRNTGKKSHCAGSITSSWWSLKV